MGCPSRLPRRLALFFLITACSGGEVEDRHIRLAHGFLPRTRILEEQDWAPPLAGQGALRLIPSGVEDDTGLWVESVLPAELWSPWRPGVWKAPRFLPGMGSPPEGGPRQRLFAGGEELVYTTPREATRAQGNLEPGTFTSLGDGVFVYTGSAEQGPGEARYREYIDLGKGQDGRWRVKLGPYYGDGLLILPGHQESVITRIPPASTLRFATHTFAWSATPEGSSGSLRFEVRLDDTPIFEHVQEAGMTVRSERHAIELPRGGAAQARISFLVHGDGALAGFFEPVIGPSEVGSPGQRPWQEERPDLVLFLADTYRADNLSAYGGDPSLSPNLNRYMEEARVYTHSWASSTWTLPSHATMFSGLLPYESGVTAKTDTLAQSARTIAEALRDEGYRTGAVTDHAFVSSSFGMAQGFEWFEEEWVDFEHTMRGVCRFLDGDDGRPTFLFVQTYRVHVPYLVSEETRRERGAELGIVKPWDRLMTDVQLIHLNVPPGQEPSDEILAYRDAYRALYLGTVIDLDREFEDFRRELEGRGFLPGATLLFTSDHGEGFWEHGLSGHGNGLNEEHLRIPLFLIGPDVTRGTIDHPASLLDVPRTLAALAGIDPDPTWGGTDLLQLDQDRRVLSYQCPSWGGDPVVVIVDEDKKVVFQSHGSTLDDSELIEAYDLARDPHEESDAHAAGEAWPRGLLSSNLEDVLTTLERRLAKGAGAELSAEEMDNLRALGYMGDEQQPDDE